MPFIGNQPALSYTSFAKQDFTTSATTSYTLDNPVTNANELALFINFVRQEPTTAYTASGTSLTLTSATSASDDMYCVFLGKAVQTVNPPNGSVGLSQLSATGTPSSSTFLRGDNSWVAAGGTNTPAFEAYLSANQNVSNDTITKLNANTEIFDTAGAYDNSTNYRFTPLTAGKYFVYGSILIHAGNTAQAYSQLFIYKNGSFIKLIQQDNGNNPLTNTNLYISAVVDMNGSTDYLELFGRLYGNVSTFQFLSSTKSSYFGAYKIIE